ncbi:MAG TPA: MotA/TolQ/ExbB proton channel family protein [Flavobacterium sp.]|jgi:biopolymer transport protein ExbB|uniref:MotA/TolQ/ExbB proton channel family protein n=1 Tax=unclassified Flavobacterium TaxID=196869 RepID=UPI000E80414C|nr:MULTISPECIES: MotA/TolQ/ExbB proton channel family protein [unclassified Flavobacterium]HBI01590.1 biopolymer transporter ExbB [Flavobacterium sp.]HRE78222.1 MotA/TolQ/ExbB proton channel family protein [Flavobacterium sp.]
MQPADSLATAQNALLEDQPVEKTLSIWDLITSGGIGGQLIMITLALLLFFALYLYFERLMAINAASKIDINFMNNIKMNITNGKIDAAKMLCAQTNSPVARLTEKGISRIGKPLEDINTAIENAGKLEIYKLEKNVSMLATISGAGPMIGFLGTVIGMILAFHKMASGGGQIEVGALAEGIYTAMTTTVAGLIVGIIAFMGYNHLVVKTDKVVHQMEANATDFLDLLNEPS